MFRSQRVLLVGNHQERLWRIQELLEPLSHAVFVARSRDTALELCREYKFAAVLIDFEKMGREAVEAAEHIHSDDGSRGTPVILLGHRTGLAAQEDLQVDIDDPRFGEIISTKIGVKAPVESIRSKTLLNGDPSAASHLPGGEAGEEMIAQVLADIADPLRGMQMTAEWLGISARARLDERERESLDTLWSSGQRGIETVRKLSEYVLVNEIDVPWEHVDCDALLRSCMIELRIGIAETHACVTWNHLPSVWAIRPLLKRVFLNLLDNAIRYRSADSPLVAIACAAEKDRWIFSVRDNGAGIPQARLKHIFRPFSRRAEKNSHGAGVGLAICKVALGRMGGRIWAESSENGSTFHFVLPRAEEDDSSAVEGAA